MRRLLLASVFVVVILISGIVGYRLIEGWSLLDALYMTIITVSTVGFREITPLSVAGKVFTVILICGGVGTIIFAFGTLAEFLVEGHLTGLLGRRRMERRIERLNKHYIVCGFGRVGEQVAKELVQADVPFVIIDSDPDKMLKCEQECYPYVIGDAAEDDVLEAAGVGRAKGLIAVVDDDGDNTLITLSAKGVNPTIFVVARAEQAGSEPKLKKAGADRVVSPIAIGGRRIAAMVLRPLVTDYLDVMAHGEDIEFQLEESELAKDSTISGMSIKAAGVRDKTGVFILAIKKADGRILANPSPSEELQAGDRLVIMGTKDQLKKWNGFI